MIKAQYIASLMTSIDGKDFDNGLLYRGVSIVRLDNICREVEVLLLKICCQLSAVVNARNFLVHSRNLFLARWPVNDTSEAATDYAGEKLSNPDAQNQLCIIRVDPAIRIGERTCSLVKAIIEL